MGVIQETETERQDQPGRPRGRSSPAYPQPHSRSSSDFCSSFYRGICSRRRRDGVCTMSWPYFYYDASSDESL